MKNKSRLQRGFTILELTVTIAVLTLLVIFSLPTVIWKVEEAGMGSTGIYMGVLKKALENYNISNHDALSFPTATVTGFANPFAPTIEELKTAKYIASPSFPSLTPQRLPVLLKINTANCPGANCQIYGIAYTTKPLVYTGTTEPRYDLVAAYLSSPGAGGSGIASQFGSETILKSATFNMPNPVPAQSGGIIGIATYLDEGIFTRFVKINDTRDPNLQGQLTVAGQITGKSSIGTVDGVSLCLRAALTTGGQVLANSTNCIRRAFLDGSSGQAGVADATGATRVLLDGSTGGLSSKDGAGRDAAGIKYNALNQSVAYADNMKNNSGTAGINIDGSVFGTRGSFNTVNVSSTAVAGAGCSVADDVVRTTVGGRPALLMCSSGIWQSTTGVAIASVGGLCPTNGAPGLSPSGIDLICAGGQWTSKTNRFGRFAATDNYENVVHGTIIAKPICPSGSTEKIYLEPQGIVNAQVVNPANYDSNFRVDNVANPGYFTVVVDKTVGYNAPPGASLPGYALAITGCYFN